MQYIKIDDVGNKFYYKDKEMSILHRKDGPAIEWGDGGEYWYLNGELHRKDGPAVELNNGTKYWWLNNVSLTEEQHSFCLQKAVEFTLTEIAEKFNIPVEKLRIKE